MVERNVAVLGASGYTGMELVRLLLAHPAVNLRAATSRTHAGKRLDEVFPRYAALPGAELSFIDPDMDAVAASGAEVALPAAARRRAMKARSNSVHAPTRGTDTCGRRPAAA